MRTRTHSLLFAIDFLFNVALDLLAAAHIVWIICSNYEERKMQKLELSNISWTSVVMVALVCLVAGCGSGGSGGSSTPINTTMNPVLDFYINRSVYTDTTPFTLWGYGVDTAGTATTGNTGLDTGTTGAPPRPYQNFYKLIFNFNISALSSATIQSATLRIYQNGVSGTTQNAILENIFYGNTDSLPSAPRDYGNEMAGYIVTPAIAGTVLANAVGWQTFDVKAKLQADINGGRSNSQFRLSHADETSLANLMCDWNLTHNASNKPELVVVYTKGSPSYPL
jgi:hypothetical protein